jgi:hypothetical protein
MSEYRDHNILRSDELGCWLSAAVALSLFIVFAVPQLLANWHDNEEFQLSVTAAEKASAEDLKFKAQRGDAGAQFELSKAYMNGVVFKPNPAAAVKWARAAAVQGLAGAQMNLGTFYYVGAGVPRTMARHVTGRKRQLSKANLRRSRTWECFTHLAKV